MQLFRELNIEDIDKIISSDTPQKGQNTLLSGVDIVYLSLEYEHKLLFHIQNILSKEGSQYEGRICISEGCNQYILVFRQQLPIKHKNNTTHEVLKLFLSLHKEAVRLKRAYQNEI